MDEAGRKATDKVAKLLKTGKTKIVSLPSGFKDANEMLMAGQQKAFKDAWYNAKTYTPSGLVSVSDQKKRYLERPNKLSVPFPWQGLNEKLEGLRQGEVVVLTAGTGLGKSAVCRELQHHLLKSTTDSIGMVMLEESYERTIDGLVSIEANEQLFKDSIRDTYATESLSAWHDTLFEGDNKNRVWVYEHFGDNTLDSIAEIVKFMAAGSECKWIFIDHIHMISAAGGDNETAEINKIMHKFRDLCEELNICIVTVSHLRRLDGNKGHENGAEVNLSHLRGSHVIAQIADSVIALERNQQAADAVESRTTKIRILKNRYSGEVGVAGHILYDPHTGRLEECDDSDLEFNSKESLI
jgi:twinkle protein